MEITYAHYSLHIISFIYLPLTTKGGEPKKITAGIGTMKRKRQFRELLDNYNDAYNEDVFDSTPLKNKNKLLVGFIGSPFLIFSNSCLVWKIS